MLISNGSRHRPVIRDEDPVLNDPVGCMRQHLHPAADEDIIYTPVARLITPSVEGI